MTSLKSLADEYATELANSLNYGYRAGEPFGVDDVTGEPFDAYEWLTDILDLRYIVSSDKGFIGARLLLTYGGPTTWLDTTTGALTVFWDTSATEYVVREVLDLLNTTLEDLYFTS